LADERPQNNEVVIPPPPHHDATCAEEEQEGAGEGDDLEARDSMAVKWP
jgi:hypothetical protein